MTQVLLVGAGGGLGAMMRWWVAGAISGRMGSATPAGIFIVNISGCLLIGLLEGILSQRGWDGWKPLLIAGLLGGYTTFSTFGAQTFEMIRSGGFGLAALNAAGSVVAGLLAVWAGLAMSGR
ncbi:MAG TPA: fluoride efflux transporter CrcB [Verrucomicrobiales bacterium]|jgi:CrcB protein|nr:fluoride efflux transporter CrcB [Verrucomicrobiales bacterium]